MKRKTTLDTKFSYCLHLACLLAKNHSLGGLISMDKSHVFILCSLYQFFHFFIEIGKPGNTSMINCGYNCWYCLYRKLSLELTFLISFTAINSPEIFDSVKRYGYSPGFDLSFWSAVVKIYSFATSCWVNKDENI